MIFFSEFRKALLFSSPSGSGSVGSRSLSYFLTGRATASSPKLLMNCKKCKSFCQKRTVQKNNANNGRHFYSCSNTAAGCKFFAWADGKPSGLASMLPTTRPVSSTPDTSVPLANTLVVYTDGACIGKISGTVCVCSSMHTDRLSLMSAMYVLPPPPTGNQNVQKKACPAGWGVVVLAGGGELGPRQDEGSGRWRAAPYI